jgi:hypothetical protein
MAESVKFASTPGGKGSPMGGGGGLSVGSPRRSPTHRFSMGDSR